MTALGNEDGSAVKGMRAILEHEEDQEAMARPKRPVASASAKPRNAKGCTWLCEAGAGDRVYQRREYIADADTGSDESNAGEAGPDHFGGSEIHIDVPFG